MSKGGAWVARIWAEDSGVAWGLANTAFTAFYEKPSAFDIQPASARYAQDVANCGGKRLRDIAWESGKDSGRERFYMASKDDVGIPTGAPVPDGRTLQEQGYEAGVGVAEPVSDWRSVEVLDLECPAGFDNQVGRSHLFAAGFRTVWEAWDLIESGRIAEVQGMTLARVRPIEAAIVKLRHEAGDPAPNTAPIEVPKPRKSPERTFEVFYRDDLGERDELIPLGQIRAKNLEEATDRACQAYIGQEVATPEGVQLISEEDLVVKGPIAPARKRKEPANATD